MAEYVTISIGYLGERNTLVYNCVLTNYIRGNETLLYLIYLSLYFSHFVEEASLPLEINKQMAVIC